MDDKFAAAVAASLTTGAIAKNRTGFKAIVEHCPELLGGVQTSGFRHGTPRLTSETEGWDEQRAIAVMLKLKPIVEAGDLSFTKYYNVKKCLGVIASLRDETWIRVGQLFSITKIPAKAVTPYVVGKGYAFPLKKPEFAAMMFTNFKSGDLFMFVLGKVLVCIHLHGLRPCDARSVFSFNTRLHCGKTWSSWRQSRHKSNKQIVGAWQFFTICCCGSANISYENASNWTSCFHCCMTWLHARCSEPEMLRRVKKEGGVSKIQYGPGTWHACAADYFEACGVEQMPLCNLRKGFAAITERAGINFTYVREVVDDTYGRWKASYSPDSIRGTSDAMVGGEQSESFHDCTTAIREMYDWLRSDRPASYDLPQPTLSSLQGQLDNITAILGKMSC